MLNHLLADSVLLHLPRLHLPDAQAAFRQGFLAEVAACAGSFAWLILGRAITVTRRMCEGSDSHANGFACAHKLCPSERLQ